MQNNLTKLMSGTLGLAMTVPITVIPALANTASPMSGFATSAQHAFTPALSHHATLNSSTTSSGNTASGFNSIVHNAASTAINHAATSGSWTGASLNSVLHGLSNYTPTTHDVNLRSAAAVFSASSLAGFSTVTLDIGGKSQTFDLSSKLTGAELVAAEQVLSGGTQTLVINSRGVATGGTVDLNTSTLSALTSATGGTLNSLSISHGVQVTDSLATLQLAGSFVNFGTLLYGAPASATGQTVDTISATNIYNASSGLISSAPASSGLTATGLSLEASNLFYNSGTISSASTLNITAPTVYNVPATSASGQVSLSGSSVNINTSDLTNSGTITALTGSINIINTTVDHALNLNGDGSYKALDGNINIQNNGGSSDGTTGGDVSINSGNFYSQQLNLNAGCGDLNVTAGNVTGVVNTSAGNAHVAAATENLQLGTSNVSGDPLYYNSSGDITIDSGFSATPGQDVAIIASRNIIGNGGTIDTSNTAGKGGSIVLAAGANFTADSATEVTLSNSTLATKGSATGGYIDLSGITLTGSKTNSAVVAVDSGSSSGAAGSITMVAYTGSQANSGSIVATAASTQTSGATTVSALGKNSDGVITMIGGGAQITAQNVSGGAVYVSGAVPTIAGGNNTTIDIVDGTVQAGSGSFTAGAATNTTINVGTVNSSGTVALNTAGKLNVTNINTPSRDVYLTYGLTSGSSTAPINIDAANLSVISTKPSASISIAAAPSTGGTFNLGYSSLLTGGTLNLTSTKNIVVSGDITATTVNLTGTNGASISGAGTITATTANLNAAGNISANTNVNNLAVVAGGTNVTINEGQSAGKITVLGASSVGNGGTFSLGSTQQVTVNAALTATDGNVNISESGDFSTVGINVGAPINVGTGSITLSTDSASIVESRAAVLTAPTLTINAGGIAGTTAAPITTKATTLVVNGNSTNAIYIKDTGTASLTVSGSGLVGAQDISITSAAANLTVGSLQYSDVKVVGSNTAGTMNLNSGLSGIGDGTGAVTLTSVGSISRTSGSINGASVVISSTKGDIGASGLNNAVVFNTPILTATAVAGSVYGNDTAITTLNAGTAKVVYNLEAYALTVGGAISAPTISLSGYGGTSADLVIGANIGTSTSTSVNLSSVGNMFQTLTTAVVAGKDVTLTTTGNGALIGFGTGTQSVVTKATVELDVNAAANSVSYVTQSGNILFAGTGGTGANLNLALSNASGKLTTAAVNYDTLSLTAPGSYVLPATSTVTSNNLTITAPVVTLTAGGELDLPSNGSLTFASTGALALTGPTSTIPTVPTTITFTAPTSITLGSTTNGSNNPLPNIGNSTIDNLTINTNGIFKGAYTSFIMNGADAQNSISITASNIVNSGTKVGTTFVLQASGGSDSVSLTLSGAQAVVLGTGNVTVGQQVEYQVIANGVGNNTIDVSAVGNLTLKNQSGLTTGGTGNSISLGSSHLLSVPFDIFSNGVYDTVSLAAGAGRTFTINAGTTGTLIGNGIAGTITADTITVSDPTSITNPLNNTITGGNITFQTANLINNGSVAEVTSVAVPSTTLTISNSAGAVTESTSVLNPQNIFTGVDNLRLQSNTSSINTTNLVNLLNGGGFDSLIISAATSVTLPTTLDNLQVNNGGTIYFAAGSVTYSPKTTNSQPYLSLTANGGQVTLQLKSLLTLGQLRGQYDIEVGNTGSYNVSSGAALTVSEVLNTASGSLSGTNITVNSNVTTSGNLTIQAGNTITESLKSVITAGSLTVGNGAVYMPTTALNVSSGDIQVLSGSLNLANAYIGPVSLSQAFDPSGLKQLTFTNSQSTSLTVNSLFTTGGSITIVDNKGPLNVAAGSNIETTNGSITLQNNDLTSTIDIGKNVTIYGSSVVGGLGQVNIVMGKVPTSTLLAGPQPGPVQPISTSSGAGKIYYTTTANPHSSITVNGLITLNAAGRNIVFNGAGNSSAITLEGNDSITADPPVVAGGTVASTAATMASTSGATLTNFTGVGATSLASSSNVLESATAAAASLTNANSTLAANVGLVSANSAMVNAPMTLTGGVRSTQKGDSIAGLQNGEIKYLEKGVTVYAPLVDTEVRTGFGIVHVAAKSAVVVMAFDGGVAVYNLHDNKRDAVRLAVGDHNLAIAPGRSAVLTDRNVRFFEEINPAQGVGYRHMVGKDLKDGIKSFESEFNVFSMLHAVAPLQAIVGSKDAQTRKIASSILKTAAILMQFGGAPYELMSVAPMTALNNHER